jgi:integral membrane protein (TIGR01906 family)
MKKSTIVILLFTITFVLSIFLSSTKYVVFNHDFYKKEFAKHNVYDKIYNADEISEKIIGFFNNNNDLPLVFNNKETSHLKDVKQLIKKGNILLISLSLMNIILLSLLLYYKKSLKKIIIYPTIVTFIIPIPLILLNFSNLFIKFHLIFFLQGTWTFVYDSLIIQLFSQNFFYDAMISIIIFSVLFILIIFFSSRFSSN